MPVINPIWFYLMSVCDGISWIAALGFFVAFISGAFMYFMGAEETKKRGKKLFVVGVVCAALIVLCPTQKTLEKMLIAQNVTYERVEQAADTVTDVYNDIMDLFRESEDVDQ